MAAFRYKLVRRSIVEETFYVDADSEDEATDIANSNPPDPEGNPEWIEWYDDWYEIIDTESLDPLYTMIKTRQLSEQNT